MNLSTTLRSFERRMHCKLCICDLLGWFRPFLSMEHLLHEHPTCALIKANSKAICMEFDLNVLVPEMQKRMTPFWKQCHAGLVEYVVPINRGERLIAILQVGPFKLDESNQRPALVDKNMKAFHPSGCELLNADGRENVENCALLLADFLKHWEGLKGQDSGHYSRRGEKIRDYMSHHFHENITLMQLALHMKLSSSRVSQLLSKDLNNTLPKLLWGFRFEHAKRLLMSTSLPLKSVAMECGFDDPNYFSKKFSEEAGESPKNYRKHRSKTIEV